MVKAEQGIETSDALRITGVDRVEFNNAVARKFYSGLPPAEPGRPRVFMTDDLIALQVFQGLLDIGATPRWAGAIAADVRAALRASSSVKTLTIWKVLDKNGSPGIVVSEQAPPDGTEIFPMSIAKYRRAIRQAIAEQFAREEADE